MDEGFVAPSRSLSPAYRKQPLSDVLVKQTPYIQRSTIDEIVWRIRDHITAVADAGLSIDLIHRPKRPVLDRRRSTIVEEGNLGTYGTASLILPGTIGDLTCFFLHVYYATQNLR